MREIVLDTETTGLSPAEGHRLVEIGASKSSIRSPTGAVFHVLINPERDVPEDAYRVHGHSTALLADKPVFAGSRDRLSRLHRRRSRWSSTTPNSTCVSLTPNWRAIGRDADRRSTRVVDTLALARRKHPGAPNSLDALCDRYRIDRSQRVKHGALLDAEILVEVYGELTGGRQRSLRFRRPRCGAPARRPWTPGASGPPLRRALSAAESERARRACRDARRRRDLVAATSTPKRRRRRRRPASGRRRCASAAADSAACRAPGNRSGRCTAADSRRCAPRRR